MSVRELERITASCNFPRPTAHKLYDSRDEAHAAMMVAIGEALREIKSDPANYEFPNESDFLAQVRFLWKIWSNYCPRS